MFWTAVIIFYLGGVAFFAWHFYHAPFMDDDGRFTDGDRHD